MTHLLWKYFWDDDLEKFRGLLAPTAYNAQSIAARSPVIGASSGSPGAFGTSPRAPGSAKARKVAVYGLGHGPNKATLGKAEINSRDHVGLTVLLRAASSTSENALAFVQALLEHPSIDIYVQDPESGWNALHRALYAGNVSIARTLLQKERKILTGHTGSVSRVGQLIKTKDHEGNSPFELYNSTIGERALKALEDLDASEEASQSDEGSTTHEDGGGQHNGLHQGLVDGDELFAFGSNKNISLGVGDHDDRQYPERVYLKRPDFLLQRFYGEYWAQAGLDHQSPLDLSKIPALTRDKSLLIHDVALSKLHSAVITADPVSNLYVCGIGRGGRLGLGDENTRFHYTPVQGGLAEKKVVQIALGKDHSMAITDNGELWTWGSNSHCQLGYALPPPTKPDEEPISPTPRQVFGPLKKEVILGIAASSIHSVAHTGSSLYCWGKNVGQLALMDADSRSLEVQQSPRKVAPSIISGETIIQVSAIDKATTLLLQNHSVFVLTAYGYVKLSFTDTTPLHWLGNLSMSSRYDPSRNRILHVASGGDGTIAAVTARGDLFTATLDHKLEANPGATSTTNPSKIKGAVTQPQCIWSAKKDGARSVSVGENGSVIFSTQSGAVWRRVKRPTARDVKGLAGTKRKDFKFQRVPYITRVATVRASPYGAFAAIRKDSDVMKHQINIDPPTLAADVAALSCLKDFKASDMKADKGNLHFWDSDALEKKLGLTAYQVLKSPDVESDLQQYLNAWSHMQSPLDFHLCTSSCPELRIPVHGWLLAARSPLLRSALAQFRKSGAFDQAETFTIAAENGKPLITLYGVDVLTLLNLVHFMYEDRVIPAWNFTRQAPALAYRYRQVRTEVMKLALRLSMPNLESAARLQVDPKKCMDKDFKVAIKNRSFFEDGDALLQLDGLEVPVHSSFICQRCLWFEGLFNGRSKGMWLASRRQDPSEKIKIDLKDMDPEAFKFVLQYLYGDFGTELFEPVVTDSLDDFIDLVMDVLGMADYLLLDRLSQICQHVLGAIVNTRNASHLLNEISPFSVSEFKDAGLEYTCLQLENQLENHYLDDLDDDLLLELDDVVRGNQATQFPFARSGRAELLLHEKYPQLAEDITEERQRRVKEMAFKATQREEERKLASSLKGKVGSLDDFSTPTPLSDRTRRFSKGGKNVPFSPELRPKESQADLMFAMDEDSVAINSPLARASKPLDQATIAEIDAIPPLSESWRDNKGKATSSSAKSPLASLPPLALPSRADPAPTSIPSDNTAFGNPWGKTSTATSKTDLRDLLMSAPSNKSALSAGLADQKAKESASKAKMSQKERKRQQHAQAAEAAQLSAQAKQPQTAWEKPFNEAQAAPWKLVANASKTSMKDLLAREARPPTPKPLVGAEIPPASIPRRTASPDTRFPGQQRVPSNSMHNQRPPLKPSAPSNALLKPAPQGSSASAASKPLVPHSKSYLPPQPKTESILGLSMTDIIGQQQREQQSVKDAVAKRSLQDIQTEQEFEEWWEAESRRTQEEEARKLAREKGREEKEAGGKKGTGRRGRGGKARAAGASGAGGGPSEGGGQRQASQTSAPGGGGKGRGRGGNPGAGSAPMASS